MQVIFHKESLMRAIKDALKFVPNTTPHLYQKFILFRADPAKDRVELYAVSPDGGICLLLPDRGFGDSPAVIEQPGMCALDARMLGDIVRKLPGHTVQFRTTGTVTTIRAGKATFDVQGMSPETFVSWTADQGSTILHLQSRTLLHLLERTVYASAKTDARPILTGVHIAVTEDRVTMEATDSFRLARAWQEIMTVKGDPIDVVVPADALSRLAALLPDDDDEEVELCIGHAALTATWGDADVRLTLRCLEGRYPQTERIIPFSFTEEIEVPRVAWLEACHRVLTICGRLDSSVAQFTFGDGRLDLSARSPDIGQVADQVEDVQGICTEMRLSFNVRYILDALQSLSADTVCVGLTGTQSAAVIRAQGEASLCLILPMRQVQEASVHETKTA